MTTAADIITRVGTTLNDIGQVRWTEAEIIRAINDSQQELLKHRPDLFATYADLSLVAGNEQSIPANGYMLLDVLWNIDSTGAQGKAITKISRAVLDRQRRAWSEKDASLTVRHWTQDKGERTTFFVAPRQPNGTSQKVRIRYAARPDTVSASGDTLDSPEECINAIYYFCTMRCLEKDEKFSGSPQAARFGEMFAAVLSAGKTAKVEQEAQVDLNEEA